MRFARPLFYLIALASLAVAQSSSNANPFNIPSSGLSFTAGQQSTISWKPTTDGTVTILLRSGSSNNLDAGVPIASSIANTGSYSWTPDPSITRGSDYTLEIVDDSDPTQVNYSPYFVIDSTNTVASSTGSASASASATASSSSATSSAASSSATSSATAATASASSASSSTSSSASSTTGSASSSATSSASKSSSATSTTLTTSASKTSSASATASTTAPSVNSAAGLKVGGSLLAAGLLAAIVV